MVRGLRGAAAAQHAADQPRSRLWQRRLGLVAPTGLKGPFLDGGGHGFTCPIRGHGCVAVPVETLSVPAVLFRVLFHIRGR